MKNKRIKQKMKELNEAYLNNLAESIISASEHENSADDISKIIKDMPPEDLFKLDEIILTKINNKKS